MIASAFVLLSLLSSSVFAANDWSVPCFNGECSYDTQFGSITISGSPAAIADITKAGGWTILDCDPKALNQDIRAVCHNSASCNLLWDAVDPVKGSPIDPAGKLVRLPESCGANAFARIGRVWVHKDQSIPSEVRSIVRRDGDPTVQGIALDTNFAATDPATTGDVNLSVQGANIPGLSGNATIVNARAVRLRQARGLGSFIENAFNQFNSFDQSITQQLPPVDIDQTFPLLDQSLNCPAAGSLPAITASVHADVAAKAHAVVTIGIAAQGTIIPPQLTSFGAYTDLNADFRGTLDVKGDVTGTADTGLITFFETGLPGLDFPGILTIGPSFKLQGQAIATLDVGVDMQLDLAYTVKDAKLFFPQSATQTSGGGFTADQSPLKLSVTPSVSSKGTVEGHFIPVVALGLNALNGAAQANIFLNLDASAKLTLTLGASDTAAVDTTGATSNAASVNGCVDIGGGIGVNAGADASFFSLFDKNTQVNLFQKNFDFFKKCFNNGTPTRRSFEPSSTSHELSRRFDIQCPTADFSNLVSVADEQIAAQSRRRNFPRFALARKHSIH